MLGVALSAPDHTTLSRRGQRLDLSLRRVPLDDRIHLIVDSTGLSIAGDGEVARVTADAAYDTLAIARFEPCGRSGGGGGSRCRDTIGGPAWRTASLSWTRRRK